MIGTKINPRDMDKIRDHNNPMCRFKHDDGRVEYTHGILVTAPLNPVNDKH